MNPCLGNSFSFAHSTPASCPMRSSILKSCRMSSDIFGVTPWIESILFWYVRRFWAASSSSSKLRREREAEMVDPGLLMLFVGEAGTCEDLRGVISLL